MLNNKGQTLVELSLVIVLLLTLVVGFTEFSRAWNHTTVLANGARAGARYASRHPLSASFASDVTDYTAFQVMTGLKIPRDNVVVNMSAFSSAFTNATAYVMSSQWNHLRAGARLTVIVRHGFQGLGGGIVPVISTQKQFVRRATMRYEGN